jgi:hypothetical protein
MRRTMESTTCFESVVFDPRDVNFMYVFLTCGRFSTEFGHYGSALVVEINLTRSRVEEAI